MNPYASWAIVLALIVLSSWYYAGCPNLLARLTAPVSTPANDERSSNTKIRKKPKTKKDVNSDDNKDTGKNAVKETLHQTPDAPISRKRKIAVQPMVEDPNMAPKGLVQTPKREEQENDESNKAFADRMSKLQAGNSLKATEKTGLSKKEQRAQKAASGANQTASPIISTGPSSSTGAEADDDMSPITSPPSNASKSEATKPGDVSDMLETGPGGPSVLRLTGEVTLGGGKKVVEAPFQAAETKKQRQARAKRERQKEDIAEAEKQRKTLMEQQIKAARLADGTSKQLKANAFNAKPNAWSQATAQKSPNGGQIGNVAKAAPLLDTFDSNQYSAEAPVVQPSQENDVGKTLTGASGSGNDKSDKTEQISPGKHVADSSGDGQREIESGALDEAATPLRQHASSGNKPLNSEARKENKALDASDMKKKSWADDLPSEEEQMRRLQTTEEDSWNVVTSRKDKKKVPRAKGLNDNDTGFGSSSDVPAVKANLNNGHSQPKATASQNQNSKKGNGFASLAIPTLGEDFQDSAWEA